MPVVCISNSEADVERIKDEYLILHKLWEDRDKFNVYVPSIEESLKPCQLVPLFV